MQPPFTEWRVQAIEAGTVWAKHEPTARRIYDDMFAPPPPPP
jgi:hypothetical protein